jgi:conjugative transposon TraM protein
MKKNLQKTKMLLILPLVGIPFLTLGFYALGGGQGKQKLKTSNELKLTLPSLQLKDDAAMDKLGFYDKAWKDSLKRAEWRSQDPFFNVEDSSKESNELERLTAMTASRYNQRLQLSPGNYPENSTEEELSMKLKLLQHELDNKDGATQNIKQVENFDRSIDRLKTMMKQMKEEESEDPEIKQLSGVMDKILDIQHPERVKERAKEKSASSSESVFTVLNSSDDDTASGRFFGMRNDRKETDINAGSTVVHENQLLVNGSIIRLRLSEDVFVNNNRIGAGSFVFGVVSLNGERLEINISSVRAGNAVFPVSLEVYDMDGMAGINIPGAITRDAAKQGADNSLQLMEMGSYDPSLKAKAATAGIGALKNLMGKKVKLIKVMVKAGHRLILKNKV